MCGIAGIMMAGNVPPDLTVTTRMSAAMRHRGPDGVGEYVSGALAMVQTRLAIIDLATGQHPLYSPFGTAIIGNGEIYNYIELREELLADGAVFSTQSDFEPVLELYRRFGLEFPKRLRGMYAIALHDPQHERLVLSRDPFGIKPLYYMETPELFAFASEPQVLASAGLTSADDDPRLYVELLQLQYVTGRRTPFQGVSRLLPGEQLVVEQGRITSRQRHSTLPAIPAPALSDDEAVERLDAALSQSVMLHQRSDVPYGLFLSGGIDSSAVLAMMARLNKTPVRTFTIGFRESTAMDERPLAARLAAEVGADHTAVDFDETDFWTLLPQVAASMDDPTADYAALPTFKLAREASRSVKVVLTGEGGDEFFAGYGWYRRAVRPWYRPGRKSVRHRTGKFDDLGVLKDPTGWRDAISESERGEDLAGRSRMRITQAVDIANWLPNDLLIKLDRCLMAWSLEGRVPFVDPELGAFAFSLPDRLKVRDGLGKYAMRLWLARHLPAAEPFSRKRGFTVPVSRWIGRQASRIGPLVAGQPGVKALCDNRAVVSLFQDTTEETRMARWALLFFACWHQHHVRGVRGAADAFEHLAQG